MSGRSGGDDCRERRAARQRWGSRSTRWRSSSSPLFVAGAILRPDTFPTWDNVRNMLTQASVIGVLAIGMTFVIATSASTSRSARWSRRPGSSAASSSTRRPTLVFILGAIGFATLLGTVNATAITYGRVVPFIATLAMFSIARGLALLLNDKLPVGLLDLNGGSFGDPAPFSLLWFGTGKILGIPVSVCVFLGITIGGWIAAQPHPLRPLRRRRRRQPRGGADRRRAGAQGDLQRLRALRAAGRDRDGAALCAARQRLAGQRQPLRARRDRRRGDRRHQPGGRPGDDRRDLPRRAHLRARSSA